MRYFSKSEDNNEKKKPRYPTGGEGSSAGQGIGLEGKDKRRGDKEKTPVYGKGKSNEVYCSKRLYA